MEQQLQKLTQAILVRGELLKQLEVQCAAIQASVEEMKPKPVTLPTQASSSRSLATGELDNLMPARCSKICSGDDTASQKSALMPDAAPGSPATAALLDVANTSLTPFIGASRECADTCIITAHQLFGEMPPCADVDHAVVEATPGTDPAPPLNVVPDANVHLALVTQLATSTPSGVTANFTNCGNELNRGCPLCLHGMRKLFDEIPVRSSGVLRLPSVKCLGWCPWPSPCQVQSISHEAEARPMSWPSLGGDREGEQLKQPRPPPIQFLSGVFAEMVFLTVKRVAPMLKLVELKPWPPLGHLKCSVTCSVVGAQGSSTALLRSGNSVGPIASNIGPNSRRVLTCGMRLWQQKRGGVLDFACKKVLMLYKQELPTMDYAADNGRKSGFLDKCIANRKYKTLILRSSYVAGHEEVIAVVSYQIVPADTPYAKISLTVVRSSYQRVGIGQLLYKELSQRLQNVGVTTIFCWADKVSEGFWLKQGFVFVGEVDTKGKIRRIPVKADIRRTLCFPGGSTLMVTHLKKALLALQEMSLENLQTSQLHDVAPDSISPSDTHTAIPFGENLVPRTFGCHKVSKTGSGGHSLSGQQPKKRTYEASSSSLKSKKIRYSCHADHYQDMNRNDICDETLSKRLIKLSQSNKVRSATELFDSMGASGLQPSAHACNSLLASFVRRSSLADAMKMLEYMKGKGMATGHTYTLILKAVASTKGYIVALEMFNKIEEENESRKFLDVIVYNTMISVCGRAKDWTQAERLWRRLGENSLSGTLMTYDLLVSTFVQCGQSELAIAAYQEMLQNGLEPSEDIMKAIIASCTKEGKSEFALATFRRILSAGMKPNIIVFNSIINSLGKAGEDELACFVPGMLALGASGYGPEKVDEIMNLAKELVWTYCNFYQSIPTKLAGENYYFHAEQDMIVGTSWNILRPETVESLMYLWRLTENKTYQDWGWEIFQALEKNSRIESGYVGLKDVNTSTKDDMMQSFFLAETLKYLYLLFSPPSVISFDEWVFNTEAHPLRIVTRHNSEAARLQQKVFSCRLIWTCMMREFRHDGEFLLLFFFSRVVHVEVEHAVSATDGIGLGTSRILRREECHGLGRGLMLKWARLGRGPWRKILSSSNNTGKGTSMIIQASSHSSLLPPCSSSSSFPSFPNQL